VVGISTTEPTTFVIPGTGNRPIRPLRPRSLGQLVVGLSQIKLTTAWRRPRGECNAADVDGEPEVGALMMPARSLMFSPGGGLL
jgi:hypothetical protein